MRLSAPVYQLKRRAKSASRKRGIPFIQALDQVAIDEGFESWSLLASHLATRSPSAKVLDKLNGTSHGLVDTHSLG